MVTCCDPESGIDENKSFHIKDCDAGTNPGINRVGNRPGRRHVTRQTRERVRFRLLLGGIRLRLSYFFLQAPSELLKIALLVPVSLSTVLLTIRIT